jgi:pimeloyl-ACP methyl ester carboxylesterase
METPETKYALSQGVHIAWQSFGSGSTDLVFVPGWFSNVEVIWDIPWYNRFFERLGAFSRVVLFDKRGTGLSDREAPAFTLEDRMDDVRAVMDAVGSDRAVLMGTSEGGPMCALFAAAHPTRANGLIMMGSYARRVSTDDYPWGASPESYAALVERMETDWGSALDFASRAPSLADNEDFKKGAARYLRMSASPATAIRYAQMNGDIDIRAMLGSIRVPTLVLHAVGDRVCDIGNARYLANKIPGARLHEIDSRDHLFHWTHLDETIEEIEEFVTGHRSEPLEQSVVTTILFTDIVGSTGLASKLGDRRWAELLAEHHAQVRASLDRFRGVEVKSTGDGFHATFDGPARAIRCALHLQTEISGLGLDLRIGLHTGECVMTEDGIEGIAVHIAARVAQEASAGEVLVSQTVRDLVAGSGIVFETRGEHQLRGVPDSWRLYAAMPHGPSTARPE